MMRPHEYHSGTVTLRVEPDVGFTLEDHENTRPFTIFDVEETDMLYFVGVLKLMVKRMTVHNCRDLAILIYYAHAPTFNYMLKPAGDSLDHEGAGRLLSDELPTHLKVRVDSDLDNPYGTPFSGYFIYLAQPQAPGIAVSTLGLTPD